MSQAVILTTHSCQCYSSTDARVQVVLLSKIVLSMPLSSTLWLLRTRRRALKTGLSTILRTSPAYDSRTCAPISCTIGYIYTTTGSYSHHFCDHFRIVEETTVPDNCLYMDIDIYQLSLSYTSYVPPFLTQFWFPRFEYRLS